MTATSSSPLRARILLEATEIVSRSGFEALTIRGVAARSGCSTIGVYTHFGDRTGLVEAVLLTAWDDFDASVAAPGSLSDPVERLVSAALAYRAWAVDHPALYPEMFLATDAAIARRPAIAARGAGSLAAHRERIAAVLTDPRFADVDPAVLAAAAWTQVHGWVLAELTGAVPLAPSGSGTAPGQLATAVRALLAGFAPAT